MGFTSIWHWVLVLVVVLLLFGAGKIPRLMGDVASGIKAFKKGIKDNTEEGGEPKDAAQRTVEHQPGESVKSGSSETVKG